MTEWKSMNPTLSSSQSSIAAMKNFLADWRLTPISSPPSPLHPLVHPPTDPIPHTRPGVGNGGGRRMLQGNTSPANITTVVEMQSKPLLLSPVCPIRLPSMLFSILSFIILCSHQKWIKIAKTKAKILTFYRSIKAHFAHKKQLVPTLKCIIILQNQQMFYFTSMSFCYYHTSLLDSIINLFKCRLLVEQTII